MNAVEEREFRDNQKEIFKRLNDVEKQGATQTEINNTIIQSHKHLGEKFEDKLGHLEESFSDKLLNMMELLSEKLSKIHDETSKTNGSVIRHATEIDKIKQNDTKLVEMSKDMQFLQKTTENHTAEIIKLKDTIEPIKVAQKFPQTIKYTIIGFVALTLVSVWSILVLVKNVKKEINNIRNHNIEIPINDTIKYR